MGYEGSGSERARATRSDRAGALWVCGLCCRFVLWVSVSRRGNALLLLGCGVGKGAFGRESCCCGSWPTASTRLSHRSRLPPTPTFGNLLGP